MTDRELLEDAAEAAGYCVIEPRGHALLLADPPALWNPLTDDGDAFRLMVKADIDLVQFGDFARADYMIGTGYFSVNELYGTDPLAATRRAIVRAAAEIGRSMT